MTTRSIRSLVALSLFLADDGIAQMYVYVDASSSVCCSPPGLLSLSLSLSLSLFLPLSLPHTHTRTELRHTFNAYAWLGEETDQGEPQQVHVGHGDRRSLLREGGAGATRGRRGKLAVG